MSDGRDIINDKDYLIKLIKNKLIELIKDNEYRRLLKAFAVISLMFCIANFSSSIENAFNYSMFLNLIFVFRLILYEPRKLF